MADPAAYRGDFNPQVTYQLEDVVTENGYYYTCYAANVLGVDPATNPGTWTQGAIANAPTPTSLSYGTNVVSAGAPYAAACDAELVYGGVVTLVGVLQCNATIATNGVLATIAPGLAPATKKVLACADASTFTNIVLAVATNGQISTPNGLTSGALPVIDGKVYSILA